MSGRGAFEGPLHRAPLACWDCGTGPGQRHAVRCELSPLRWSRIRKRPAVWGPLYFNDDGQEA